MKTLNIFAILFIVSFVNTSKSISYSDMTHSLLQLHDDVDRLAVLHQITEAFTESHSHLEEFVAANTQTCTNLENHHVSVVESLNERLRHLETQNAELSESITSAEQTVETNQRSIAEESEKMQANAHELEELSNGLKEGENEVHEILNILDRLRNIAVDELSGELKKNTEMGKYNVVNEHGVSFIQKFNFNQELRNLMEKSHTSAKGLISTLIMMTGSDAHFSDPAVVQRVVDVLDRIIASNHEKLKSLSDHFTETSLSVKSLIDNSRNLVENLSEENSKLQASVELMKRNQLSNNADSKSTQDALNRRNARFESNKGFCGRLVTMTEQYEQRYSEMSQKMNDLRSEMQE